MYTDVNCVKYTVQRGNSGVSITESTGPHITENSVLHITKTTELHDVFSSVEVKSQKYIVVEICNPKVL